MQSTGIKVPLHILFGCRLKLIPPPASKKPASLFAETINQPRRR
jgi:hypothetical protein